jgi:hypothetical protein
LPSPKLAFFLTGLKENLKNIRMQKTTLALRRIITEAAEQEKLLKTKDYFVQNGR